jgi:pimeloyl-ACP methyl ester carboxylesterase
MTSYVLIPGAGSTVEFWALLIPELERRGHKAVAVDLQQDDPALGLSDFADVVTAALPADGDAVLVAQSFGGFTAPIVASRTPVRMIVLLNAMIPLPGEKADDWWDNTRSGEARRAADAAAGRSAEFDMETHFLHDLSDEARAVLFSGTPHEPSAKAFGTPCAFERWPDVPTRVLAGSDDRFFPAEFQQRVAKERLGLDVDLVPGGHLVAISNPVAVADQLVAYAAEIGAEAR